MTSFDEQQLSLAAAVGASADSADHRVAKLQGAVERLNTVATTLRTVAADVDWRGDAADAARAAFVRLAGAINEHADAVSAIATADARTAAPLNDAYRAYAGVQSVVDTPGVAYYGMGPDETVPQYRARLAAEAREQLDQAMTAARSQVTAAASWDLDPPTPAGTGTGPGAPGGVDPVGPVGGTVPDGSGSAVPGSPGQVDPVGPVGGTVPDGSGSAVPGSPGQVDPVGPVGGTVPDGSGSAVPGSSGGFDPVGPVGGTVPAGSTDAPRDLLAELTRRLGGSIAPRT